MKQSVMGEGGRGGEHVRHLKHDAPVMTAQSKLLSAPTRQEFHLLIVFRDRFSAVISKPTEATTRTTKTKKM